VYVVTGPPAAGKSAYVQLHAGPADVVIDLDRLLVALAGPGVDRPADADPQVRPIAAAARESAIRAAMRAGNGVTVWIVHALPTSAQLATYRAVGANIVTLDPGALAVDDRLAGRPADAPAAARWYAGAQAPALPGAVSTRFRVPVPLLEGPPR
jgi:hypothetical protein